MLSVLVAPQGHRQNSFDAIRLIAALMVLVGHAFVLTDAGPAPRIAGIPLHTLGVCVFFAISGYLIAGSWERGPSASRYLKNRALRIFPALVVVVVVTTFVIGPMVTTLTLSDYFGDSITWQYMVNITLIGHYDLPGVFLGDDHARSAVNGSLWTLGVEFSCYLGLLALLAFLPRLRATALLAIAVLTGTVALLAPTLPHLAPIQPAMEMAAFFFVAAAMRIGLPSRWFRIVPSLAALLGWVVIATFFPWLTWPLAWPMLTYAAVGIGAANLPVLRRAGRFGDFSYGLYLWAYPVQQVVVGATEIDSLPLNIILVSLITLLFAVASWHLIEKRALALKDVALLGRKPVATEPA